ncbi:MAG: CRISPR-associated protein Csm4 [Thermosipho sp. (in: thermotogales)]|nr:CRISPR-associated protein Csm4 [Thermosipho sp. (in: thermotogales)]
MKRCRIKLKFKTPLHVGYKEGVDNLTELFIHSDTLFSSIVNAYNKLYGLKKTETFINAIIKDNVLNISSAFYYYKNVYFYPKPLGYRFRINENNKKRLKKVEFVSEDFLYKEISNPKIDGIFLYNEDLNIDEKLYVVEERPKITVDRKSSEASIYYFSTLRFGKNSGLWFFLDLDESIEKEVFSSLKLLEDEGLGGDRTYGYGLFTFQVEKVEQAEIKGENNYLLLSLCVPEKDEINYILDYKIKEKTGFIYSMYTNTLRQPLIRFIAEGSLFSKKVFGKILDISSNNLNVHKVFKFARAYLMPIKKEAQYE